MRQLVCIIAFLLASPLLADCVCSEPPRDVLTGILQELNESMTVNISNEHSICLSSETRTLAVLYERCSAGDCESAVAVIDIRCKSPTEWELVSSEEKPSSAYESLMSESHNCSKCVNAEAAQTYENIPAGTKMYNDTTHCLSEYKDHCVVEKTAVNLHNWLLRLQVSLPL